MRDTDQPALGWRIVGWVGSIIVGLVSRLAYGKQAD